MESRRASPSVSLGIRAAAFTSLSVLLAFLVVALVSEFAGRAEARRAASEQLRRAHTLAASRLAREGESLERLAATIARDPKFFALLALRRSERSATYRASFEGLIRDFQKDVPVEIFDVTDEWGATVAASSRPSAPEPSRGHSPLVRRALDGSAALGYRLEGGRLYRIAVVPVLAEGRTSIGTLTLGSPVDEAFASVIHGATGVEVLLLAGEISARGGATASARPVVSTLPPAGARSILETLGPSPRNIGRSRLRDERAVWIAKSPAVALDVSLDGGMEGGVARLIVAAMIGPTSVLGFSRETLLSVGALAAAVTWVIGFVVGRRLARRVRALGEATRGVMAGQYDSPLPSAASDEIGYLTADIAAMRHHQRTEITRLTELDRMKTDFLTVAAQQIEAPATEIREAGEEIERRARSVLGPVAVERLRLIQENAESIERMAQDLSGASVVHSEPPSSEEPRHRESESGLAPDITVSVVAAPTAPPAPAAPPVPAVPPAPAVRPLELAPDVTSAEVDVAELVEGVAVDMIVAGAERGIEIVIAVEAQILYPAPDADSIQGVLRRHAETSLAAMPPGSALTFGAKQTETAVEIRIEGGPTPFELLLPLGAELQRRAS